MKEEVKAVKWKCHHQHNYFAVCRRPVESTISRELCLTDQASNWVCQFSDKTEGRRQ